jgi:hypothetical protein
VPWVARHETVNHEIGEYVRGDVHTNTVEGYFSILKRGIIGTFHSVSEQHLQRYMHEFDFRYNHRQVKREVEAKWFSMARPIKSAPRSCSRASTASA